MLNPIACFVIQNKPIWNCFILSLDILKSQLQTLVKVQEVTDLMPLKNYL